MTDQKFDTTGLLVAAAVVSVVVNTGRALLMSYLDNKYDVAGKVKESLFQEMAEEVFTKNFQGFQVMQHNDVNTGIVCEPVFSFDYDHSADRVVEDLRTEAYDKLRNYYLVGRQGCTRDDYRNIHQKIKQTRKQHYRGLLKYMA